MVIRVFLFPAMLLSRSLLAVGAFCACTEWNATGPYRALQSFTQRGAIAALLSPPKRYIIDCLEMSSLLPIFNLLQGSLRIVTVPSGLNLDYDLPMRKVPLKRTAAFITYHHESHTYAVATSKPEYFKFDTEVDTVENFAAKGKDFARRVFASLTRNDCRDAVAAGGRKVFSRAHITHDVGDH